MHVLGRDSKTISKKREIDDFLSAFQDKAVRGETFDASAAGSARGKESKRRRQSDHYGGDRDGDSPAPSTNVWATLLRQSKEPELFAQWGRIASVKTTAADKRRASPRPQHGFTLRKAGCGACHGCLARWNGTGGHETGNGMG